MVSQDDRAKKKNPGGGGLVVLLNQCSKDPVRFCKHAFGATMGYLDYPHHEEEDPGRLRVSAVFAGAPTLRMHAFGREAEPISKDIELGVLGGSKRVFEARIPLRPKATVHRPAPTTVLRLCSSEGHMRGA